ncbi:hypothetical protein O181_071060 [Austropuccinia psidii MF-1]|uniref:Uncharacterized protein n=1 Tax=Austropuccinia psidii MF-1 TaxID=1389203 RepID=A0A9Q3EXQ8_9BASI|nr:hypothetical protein [Austropuccinia psidii MF-1]
MSVLNTKLTHIALLLQEPWTNPYDWLPPTHPNWHRYAPRLTPTNRNERTRACIYINRSIPTHQILYLPDNNNLLSWVTINNIHPAVPKITLLALYNTPPNSMASHSFRPGSTTCREETHPLSS